jgi:excisionase family DNA binding protein
MLLRVSSEFRTESDASAYLSIRMLARYSGLSVRTLRKHLSDPIHPIPHYRVGGKILVNRREFDAWIVAFREKRPSVDSLLADVLKGF